MIITCPSCGARYKVKDDLIPNSGKRVKCKKCAALFRAFPDKKAILEKKAPAPAAEPPAPKPVSSQATVMVDQAKLSSYLQQNNDQSKEPEQSAAAPSAPPAPEPVKPSHATVQIDRTKIDAFLQNKVDNAGGDYEPNTTLEVSREELDTFLSKPNPKTSTPVTPPVTTPPAPTPTSAAPPVTTPPAPEPTSEEPAKNVEVKIDQEKFEDLQRALGASFDEPGREKKTVEMPPPVSMSRATPAQPLFDEVASELNQAAPPQKELDLTVPVGFESKIDEDLKKDFEAPADVPWEEKQSSPIFPSDEELGLNEEPEGEMREDQPMPNAVSFDDVSDDFLNTDAPAPTDEQDNFLNTDSPAPTDDFLNTDSPAPTDDFLSTNAPAPTDEQDDFLSADTPDLGASFSDTPVEEPGQSVFETPTPGSEPEPAATGPLFSVKVEDTEYPNKSLEALDRWIHEGRLLETDLVAPTGSSDFQKAYDIPEIAAIFDRYFGQVSETSNDSGSEKKGFFAKLFSAFGKKK